MRSLRELGILAVLAAGLACRGTEVQGGGGATAQPDPVVRVLQVLATNDLHGALDGERVAGGRMGGFARVAGLIDALRQGHEGPTLVLDAGDCFQGDFPVNAEEGAPCVTFFNQAGYAATTLGNHEFDYAGCGPQDATRPPEDPRCALAAALAQSKVPVVSANVRQSSDGSPLAVPGVVPFTVRDVEGIRVGITGVVTPTTPMVANFEGTRGLVFDDPVAAVRRVLPEMRQAGATVVIVLAHLEGRCPDSDRVPGNPTSRCAVDGELGTLLEAFAPDEVALVVAGHAHTVLEGEGRRTPVVETPGKGTFLGRVLLRVDAATGRVLADGVSVGALVPVCGAGEVSPPCRPEQPGFVGEAPLHPQVDASVRELQARHFAHCTQEVARAAQALHHARQPETVMGNLTADLMREAGRAAHPAGVDFAFMNQGSVRAGLEAGEVTECDLHAVWPFNDPMVVIAMTGADIERLFTFLMIEVGKTPAVSGLRLERRDGAVRVRDAATGRPLQPGRTYRVATTHYLVLGGDRVDEIIATLPPDAVTILGYPTYRDGLREAMRRRGTLEAPALGRIELR